MARKTEKPVTEKKPRTSYKQRKEARALETKTPYNWRKHLKDKCVEKIQAKEYDGPENHPEYLRAEAAIQKDLIFAELDKYISKFPELLQDIKKEAGQIETEDVMYHINLISRILKNKYEEKVVIM
jgi:hypothetical protein